MTNKILFIIFFIIIIFLHKKINKIQNNINKEKFTLTNDDETRIRSIIKDIYSTDLDAIRSLAAMSKRIQDGGLTINGDLNVTGAFNYLPRGVILSYNSITAPSGWAICDGNNGTPDLRGRFILGTGQGTNLTNRTWKDTGGTETHTLSINEIPAHNHKFSGYNYQQWAHTPNGDRVSMPLRSDYSTNLTTENSGGGSAHNNMPPYYVLTWIMKL